MRIHREGYNILGLVGVLILILSVIGWILLKEWSLPAIILFAVLYGFMIWFFRNPERKNNAEWNDVIAPVDGKVVEIKEVFENEFLKDNCIQISIFMSPLNVHVCRYPVSGKVIYTKYHKGKYLVAFHPKSSEKNERTTVVVEAENNQRVLFRQIAGFVARRIVLYAKEGDLAKAGEEYGFIKFGSRLDVYLPLNSKILVEVGQIISNGGIEKIAELKQLF